MLDAPSKFMQAHKAKLCVHRAPGHAEGVKAAGFRSCPGFGESESFRGFVWGNKRGLEQRGRVRCPLNPSTAQLQVTPPPQKPTGGSPMSWAAKNSEIIAAIEKAL